MPDADSRQALNIDAANLRWRSTQDRGNRRARPEGQRAARGGQHKAAPERFAR